MKAEKRILLSIIITVYNLQKYIAECLESVLEQELDNYQVIVVDNGSSDDSVKICEKYQALYPNKMKFFKLSQPTILGRAQKIGLENANGEYIQIVDGDDYIAKGCLKDIGEIIKQKQPDIVMGTFQCVLEQGGVSIKDGTFDKEYIDNHSYEEVLKYLQDMPSFHPVKWRYIYKKDIIFGSNAIGNIEIGKEYKVSTNDWLDCIKILINGKSISFYEKPFYFYRRCKVEGVDKSKYMNYFKTFILVSKVIGCYDLSIERLEFCISRAYMLFMNFIVDADLMSFDELKKVMQILKENTQYIGNLNNSKYSVFKVFDKLINDYGYEMGIILMQEYIKGKILVELPSLENKQVYIFPPSIKGKAIARLLSNRGIRVTGFLDNDANKWGESIQGVNCQPTKDLRKKNVSEQADTIIIIASLYSGLTKELKQQLQEEKIPEENIIVG